MSDDALDTGALDALTKMLSSDPDFVREMIDAFVEEVPARLAEVGHGIDASDAGLAGRAAHTLKSNALTFGAFAMADVARQMETAARAGDLSAAGALLPALERTWEIAQPLLREVGETA
jgi:histidine phosphotransfer protein HptB